MKIELGILFTGLGILIAYLGYSFNRTKELKTDTRQDAQIKAQLDYISKGVDDIRIDQKASERQMVALGERVTRVEESAKSLHKRLDSIENKGVEHNG